MKITTFKKNVNLVKLMIENNSDIDHLKKKNRAAHFMWNHLKALIEAKNPSFHNHKIGFRINCPCVVKYVLYIFGGNRKNFDFP